MKIQKKNINKIEFERAQPKDLSLLTKIQAETFDNDIKTHKRGESGGPPGYNSIKWNFFIYKKANYFKILMKEEIIGGIILFRKTDEIIELGRIFIHPKFQNQGIGTKSFQFLQFNYPRVKKWMLDTPNWALRNHHFYEKLGYKKKGEHENQFQYVKSIL